MSKVDPPGESEPLSRNLLGQRLGRKGRDTRDRILAATEKLLAAGPETTISLSAVAREADLGMTTLYLYFADLTELLLAVLDPVVASAEEAFISQLRTHWSDAALNAECLTFVQSYYAYWLRYARILHLRNALADANDDRMRRQRIETTAPIISLLVAQMEIDPSRRSPTVSLASVLFTGIERTFTVSTDTNYMPIFEGEPDDRMRNQMLATARLLELGIREGRGIARAAR